MIKPASAGPTILVELVRPALMVMAACTSSAGTRAGMYTTVAGWVKA